MTTDDHNPPRLILGRFRPVDLARLFLVIVPSVPGLIFLVVGLLIYLPVRTPVTAPEAQAARARTVAQARGLFLAGATTLAVGTLGMAAVVWKIARTGPEEAGDAPPDDGAA